MKRSMPFYNITDEIIKITSEELEQQKMWPDSEYYLQAKKLKSKNRASMATTQSEQVEF